MARKRSRKELAAIAAKGNLISGINPLEKSREDDRFIINLKTSTDESINKKQRVKALEEAEKMGIEDRIGQIAAKRSLDLQLRGIPKSKADQMALNSVEKDTGVLKMKSSKVSAI